MNPDGTLNGFEQGLFSSHGMLYSTFQAFTFDPTTFATKSLVEPPTLYRINPTAGATSVVGPTDLNLEVVTDVGGLLDAFKDFDNQIVTLNLANGRTSLVHSFDPALGFVTVVAPTPEPTSIALMVIGVIGLGLRGMGHVGARALS